MEDSLEYLYGLQRFGVKPGLERVEKVVAALEHPELKYATVHVAGTNGKGSVSCMVESVLRKGGYKTGLYTSPHMVDFRERIQVDGRMISKEELIDLIEEVRVVSEQNEVSLTFFEFVTVIAFLYFAQQKVEIAVVEVGMGGLLDATNVVRPEVAVVTNVGLDHTEFLGDTKEKIALEKAGVFKRGAALVTGEVLPEVLAVLERQAQVVGGELVRAQEHHPAFSVNQDLESQVVKTGQGELEMRLVGVHQVTNAAVALTVLMKLKEWGWRIDWADIVNGFREARWPGRLQVLGREPLVVADSAHNEDGMMALGAWLDAMEMPKQSVLLVGLKKGRDVSLVAREVAKRFDVVIVSKAEFMAEEAGVVKQGLIEQGISNVEVVLDRAEALKRARDLAGSEGMVLVTGSIYFVGDVMREIGY